MKTVLPVGDASLALSRRRAIFGAALAGTTLCAAEGQAALASTRVIERLQLINANGAHFFQFMADLIDAPRVRITVSNPGVANAMAEVALLPSEEARVRYSVVGATRYQIDGTLTLSADGRVVRFEGQLLLVNVAEAFLANLPVLVLS